MGCEMSADEDEPIDWPRVWELRDEIGASEFDEVVALFLSETEVMVDALAGAAPETLEEELHALKGAALNLGFTSLAALCATGERMAAEGRGAEVEVARVLRTFFRSRRALPGEETGEIRGVRGLDPDQHGAEVARRFLQVFEARDVVLGAQDLEEIAQRAGALRQPEDEILLHPGIAQRAFLDLGQALEIEVAARSDADHRLAANQVGQSGSASTASAPAGSSTIPSTFSISSMVTQMRSSGAWSTSPGIDVGKMREGLRADARDRRAVDEAVDARQRYRPPPASAAARLAPPAGST
jgi:histidine phosphotransfer protein HptB